MNNKNINKKNNNNNEMSKDRNQYIRGVSQEDKDFSQKKFITNKFFY